MELLTISSALMIVYLSFFYSEDLKRRQTLILYLQFDLVPAFRLSSFD